MNRHISVAVLLGAALLASCDALTDNGPQDITAPVPSARVKFHNFSPSSVGVDFFANDTKMTAVLTSACGAPPRPPYASRSDSMLKLLLCVTQRGAQRLHASRLYKTCT